MTRSKNPPQPALFDVEPVVLATRQAGKDTASGVVAAFVDSFRSHHSGGNPLRRDIGRVARDAKALLAEGAAGPEELTAAAVEMGKGPYSNLGMALKIHRDQGARRGGRSSGVPARPHTDADWLAVAEEVDRQWHHDLSTDDEAIRWVRRDPEEVERLCERWPDLRDRFRDVA